ncbi:MAG: protein kinase [Candidatus Krumholzibacteriota bacterium]|nr:protein kinase [Candidatus Krumholzibacteriota bacterium]
MLERTISHYRIIDNLGAGGMGVVYRAEDLNLNRHVALKFLSRSLSGDENARKRFFHEARAASSLQHQNICTVYEIGEAEEEIFIAMELVEGRDLASIIAEGPLPLDEAARIAVDIARGLVEAHGKGIVHRDIKPSNIIRSRRGVIKITDFGLARSEGMTRLTREGGAIGTAAYMSPEQACGAAVDERTDIWSLGVILYEMISGRSPFASEYEQATVFSVINEEPAALSGVRSGVPLELERIVSKCMAKNPKERYQHADDLIVDLQEAICRMEKGDSTGRSAGRGAPGKNGKSKSPLPLVSVVIAAAAIAVIAAAWYFLPGRPLSRGGGGSDSNAGQVQWHNSVAVLPFRDLSKTGDQEYFCDGMTDAVNDRLSRYRELKVIATASMIRFRGSIKDIKEIGRELGVEHIVEGSVQREGERIRVRAQLVNAESGFHLWSDTLDERLESIFDVQDRISSMIAKALELTISGAAAREPGFAAPDMEAYEYYMKGMHFIKSKFVISFADDDFRAGVEMFHRALEIDPDFTMAYYGLAWAYEHHYMVTEDPRDREYVIDVCVKGCAFDPGSAQMAALKGYVLYAIEKNRDEGFGFLTRALELNPNLGEVNFLAGTCLLYHGLYEQAIPYLARALELDPYYFWTPYKLGVCYLELGDYEKSARYFDNYFEMAPVPLVFPSRYIALNVKMGDLERVRELIELTESKHPDYAYLPYCRAIFRAALGEKEEALAIFANSEVYALLGMKTEALGALDTEIRGTREYPYIFYLDLLNDPFYDNLHGDRRYQALLDREKKLNELAMKRYSSFNARDLP